MDLRKPAISETSSAPNVFKVCQIMEMSSMYAAGGIAHKSERDAADLLC